MAQSNEVEEVIKDLKKNPGFSAYVIMNKDGIVIKYESMTYQKAIHHAAVVLDLMTKSKLYISDMFESPDNELESLRVRTDEYELIVAQHENFTLIVNQVTYTSYGDEHNFKIRNFQLVIQEDPKWKQQREARESEEKTKESS